MQRATWTWAWSLGRAKPMAQCATANGRSAANWRPVLSDAFGSVLDRWSIGIGWRLCSSQPPFVADRPQCDPDLTLKSACWSTLDGHELTLATVGSTVDRLACGNFGKRLA